MASLVERIEKTVEDKLAPYLGPLVNSLRSDVLSEIDTLKAELKQFVADEVSKLETRIAEAVAQKVQ